MQQPATQIVLKEVDAELTLLGTLFMSPGAFSAVADDINPDWFSEPFLRFLFEGARKLNAEGHKLSPPTVIAMLPEDCGGIPRNQLYARACAAAGPPTALSGLASTLKDRWARRRLLEAADTLQLAAIRFDADPHETAGATIIDLDTVNASRSRKAGQMMAGASTSLLSSLERPEALRGPTTGLLALDNKLNGYVPGQLYVFAGRPGMGKSAFMCSSLRRTAAAGYGVAIFSLEMGEVEIAARCMSDVLDSVHAPPYGNILRGMISIAEQDQLLKADAALSQLPLYIDAASRLTFSEIAGRARKVKARFEAEGRFLAVLCIDHMGLVAPSDRYRGNKVAEAGEISGLARELAKDLDCCVVLLCQLSREVERRDDKRPIMSDLRWSGEIEQDAHVIGFLYREAYYLANDPGADPYQVAEVRNRLEFLIRKNRNGECADVRLWCSIAHSAVRDD